MEEGQATGAGHKPSQAEILANMGVSSLPAKKQDPLLAELEARYEAECEKARQRAQRFGLEYKAPDRAAFFEKGELKRATRMRRDEGFYVGMDLTSEAERAKIEARASKFGGHQEAWAKRLEDEEEAKKKAERAQRFGLPGERATAGLRKLSLNAERLYRPDPERLDPAELVISGEATVEGHKIHVYAVDKRGFQAIRSSDVLKFFNHLFPRFVEWLGPHACHVVFDDPSTAQRALEAVSQPLPSLEEVMAEHAAKPAATDEHQKGGEGDDAMQQEGREQQAPGVEPGEGMEGVEAAGGGAGKGDHHRKHVDLPVHGWRYAPRRLMKVKNDAYGMAGTGVRVLLRLATTADVRRPDIQPPPPPAPQPPRNKNARKRGAEQDGGFGGRGGYNALRRVEIMPMEEGEGAEGRHKRRRRGGRGKGKGAADDGDAAGSAGMEQKEGGEAQQQEQQVQQAPEPQQEQQYTEAAAPVAAAEAAAPVAVDEGGFVEEGAGEGGGDVDMFL